jgi:transcriptional regulator with XRE-family HTH domain
MQPINFIITKVFGVSGAEVARWAGVSRESVNRWMRGERKPPIEVLRPIFKARAKAAGLPWQDSWLFEVPVCDACVGTDGCAFGCWRLVELCVGHEANQSHIEAISNGNLAPKISQQVPS